MTDFATHFPSTKIALAVSRSTLLRSIACVHAAAEGSNFGSAGFTYFLHHSGCFAHQTSMASIVPSSLCTNHFATFCSLHSVSSLKEKSPPQCLRFFA